MLRHCSTLAHFSHRLIERGVPENWRHQALPRFTTIAVFSATLALWWLASRLGWVSAFLLPGPGTVAETLSELIASGELLRHTP